MFTREECQRTTAVGHAIRRPVCRRSWYHARPMNSFHGTLSPPLGLLEREAIVHPLNCTGMRLVILSDTHGLHGFISSVPDGDVLIHAGDMTGRGTLEELEGLLGWFGALPHQHKLLVAGNHDWMFERRPTVVEGLIPTGVTYLRDTGVSIAGINFWGSP